MENLDKIRKVSQLSITVLKRKGVIYAALFGSFVTSDVSKESDIDFLLEYQDGVSLFNVIELKEELEEKLGRKVDLVSLKYLNKRIREKVVQEQIRIL